MFRTIKALFQKYKEIIFYLFWGGMTTLVSWGSYSFFVTLLHSVAAANVLSWICAMLFAFATNKLWVFQSRNWSFSVVFPELWKFITARLFTGLLEILGVPLLVKLGLDQRIFGTEGMAAKIIVSIAVVILNYAVSKLFIFKK